MAREHGVLRKTPNSQAILTAATLTDFLQGENMTKTTTNGNIPPRFEDEYPEEANVLMKLCSDNKLRKDGQTEQGKQVFEYFEYEMNGTFMTNEKGTPYKRTQPKINRNAPCPCGSGKKYKKCCIIDE